MVRTSLPIVLLFAALVTQFTAAYSPIHAPRSNLIIRQDNNNGQNNNNQDNNDQDNDNQNQNNGGGDNELQLNPDNVQTASQATGQENDSDPAQAESAVDNANFINFCTGKTITNGLQIKGGSCNGIVMGDIPAQENMVSSIIINPAPGQDIAADTAFDIQVQVTNLQAGAFTNPENTYYAAPQALEGGIIVGHTHVTVQDLGGSLTPNQPPNAIDFKFFKGVNDAGNGNGLLSASVDEGLPPGNYRVCTMTSASNHQPVLMPVAQRGAQDDCTKFTVGQGGGNNNNDSNQNQNQDQQNQGQDQDQAAQGQQDQNQNQGGAAQDQAAQDEAAQGNQAAQEQNQGQGGQNQGRSSRRHGGGRGGFGGRRNFKYRGRRSWY